MENIIFILGCGHSGTTILNKVIGNHKNVYGIDYETGFFAKHKEKDTDKEITDKLNNLDKRTSFKKKWMCEKTPSHVYGIDKIFKLTKNPKIIVSIRDGRDVVASLYKRYNDFNLSVNRWIDDNNEWLSSQHKDSFHILKYEDFVKQPESELKKICNYLQEEYDDNMLDYKKEKIKIPKKVVENPTDGINHSLLRLYQINQDLYDGTKRYIKDLTEQQISLLDSNENFMELMKKFNYE